MLFRSVSQSRYQPFSNIQGKLGKIPDPNKKQQLAAEVAKKIPPFINSLKGFFDDMIAQMSRLYSDSVKGIVTQLGSQVNLAKGALTSIQNAIDQLDLSASKEILNTLADLSQEQVAQHQRMLDNSEEMMMHREFVSNATKKTQELLRTIDDMFGIYHAKVVLSKCVDKSPQMLPVNTWEIKHAGLIEFPPFKFGERLSYSLEGTKYTPDPISEQGDTNKESKFVTWTVNKLDRKQSQKISYTPQKLSVSSSLPDEDSMKRIICVGIS